MTYRRSPHKAAAQQQWERFVEANRVTIEATGIPPTVFHSIGHFDDFLAHGRLELHDDPSASDVRSLDPNQYEALVSLVESYFVAGYEWFAPLGLRSDDQDRLRARFDR